jgi:uncharacterized membrane protein
MLFVLLLGFYAVALHYAAVHGAPVPAALGFVALWILALSGRLRRGSAGAWLSVIAMAGVAAVLIERDAFMPLLYLSPVLVNLALLLTFARTLLPGEMSLIGQFVRAMGDPLSPARMRYARRATQAWTLFFAVMALECFLLARYAEPAIWSLFINFLNYLFALLFFVLEYAVRRRKFPNKGGFLGFLRSLRQTDFKQLLRQQPPA